MTTPAESSISTHVASRPPSESQIPDEHAHVHSGIDAERDNTIAASGEKGHHDRTSALSKRQMSAIIFTTTLAMMNNIGSGPAITVALPDIGRDLNIAAANLQWIVSAYSLTSVCPFSRCGNFFGFGFRFFVCYPTHRHALSVCFIRTR